MGENFNDIIINAAMEKEQWFNATELPKMQDNYRLHLTCVRNIFGALVKKSMITPDPYKKDKKVSDIICPDTSDFSDNERSIALGTRLSDYESIIDYICNYIRFSCEQIDMPKIKKLLELNNCFAWTNLTQNSNKANTRSLATALNELKNGAQNLTLSMLKDNISKSQTAITEINQTLKSLADFQRERYKIEIRTKIIKAGLIDMNKANSNVASFVSEIKSSWTKAFDRKPFSTELATEIANEELDPNCEELQKNLLAKFAVQTVKQTVKENKVQTKEILMDALRHLGSTGEQYSIIADKFETNHEVLESEHNKFADKVKKFFIKLLGLEMPGVEYEIIITDKRTDAKKKEKISYNEFSEALNKRAKFYTSFAMKGTPGYNKIAAQEEDKIFEFLNKQMAENTELKGQLAGLDEYFKNTAESSNRSKIRGITMELTIIVNGLTKANQVRAEYSAYIEEQEQMKKLGLK